MNSAEICWYILKCCKKINYIGAESDPEVIKSVNCMLTGGQQGF